MKMYSIAFACFSSHLSISPIKYLQIVINCCNKYAFIHMTRLAINKEFYELLAIFKLKKLIT